MLNQLQRGDEPTLLPCRRSGFLRKPQVGPGLLPPGGLGCLRGINAGKSNGDRPAASADPQGVAVSHREHRGPITGGWSSNCGRSCCKRHGGRHRQGEQEQRAPEQRHQGAKPTTAQPGTGLHDRWNRCRISMVFGEPHQEGAPCGGALAPVAAVSSSHQGLPIGCLWFHASPV